MKKHILLLSNLIIILSIIAGFICIVYRDTTAYQRLAEQHLQNILSLADINISKNIENSMTKPVMVSKTMANDEFLKKWLTEEPAHDQDSSYMNQLYSYLQTYQKKYDYASVFCISSKTGNYYYQNGFNKTLSPSDAHDVWYYNFIKTGHEYDLEVDTNQADQDSVTLFVNFRINDRSGQLLGIIGIGLKISLLENTIQSYNRDYGVSVYIMNTAGAKNSFHGKTSVFIQEGDLTSRTGIRDKIVLNKAEVPHLQWFTSNGERKCLITRYNKTLGWYLILEKDTSSISSMFQKSILNNILFMLVSLLICITVTTTVFLNYNKRIITMENTDDLTGLPNQKLFSSKFLSFLRKQKGKKKSLFMLDIDHFKMINDTHGHQFGNLILALIGRDLMQSVSDCGISSRWGGDEFLGVLAVSPEDARDILTRFIATLTDTERDECYHVSVSIGISEIPDRCSLEEAVERADQALYRSKNEGRGRITIF